MGRLCASSLMLVLPLAILLSGCAGGGSGGGSASPSKEPAGTLDTTFGSSGSVVTDLGSTDTCEGMAIQSDDKIVVVGTAGGTDDFGILRYTTDGALDTTFGTGGHVTTDFAGNTDNAYAVAIQPGDQKIVVVGEASSAGNFSFAVARYNPDGSLDTGFGTGGKVITDMASGARDEAHAVAIQADGKIVVAGSAVVDATHTSVAIARYNANGTLDLNFGSAGRSLVDVGQIFNGTTNYNFADIYGMAIQDDQKILVVGDIYHGGHQQMLVARFDTLGALDTTFGKVGGSNRIGVAALQVENSSQAFGVAIQKDGRIVLAGYDNKNMGSSTYEDFFALLRYTSSGDLDSTFNSGGVVSTAIGTLGDQAHALVIQSNGKVVAAGYSKDSSTGNPMRFALARYASDGSLDTTFGTGGTVTMSVGTGASSACGVGIQSTGRIVATGNARSSSDDFAAIRLM